MSNIYLIAFWIDRPSTLFAVISYDMCTVCIIYLISYVFWFQNLHFQHIWKGKCYNKRTTAYLKKSAFPLIKPLHYFCLSNLLFWWNRIFSLALNGGGRFLSPSSPLSSLLCSLVSWETLSALLSKLKYYGLTGLLMQLTLSKLGFRRNLTALTERSQPAIRWRVGEVANRVSCGSFRGGHWYLPIRNHDNRYFADWNRLCPGLSKNSENGNSCPKPHKAARMIEAVGRAGRAALRLRL